MRELTVELRREEMAKMFDGLKCHDDVWTKLRALDASPIPNPTTLQIRNNEVN